MRVVRAFAGAVVLGTAVAGIGLAAPASAAPSHAGATRHAPRATGQHETRTTARVHRHPTRHLCAAARPGTASCNAVQRTDVRARWGLQPALSNPAGYGPADLTSAYRLPAATAAQSTRTVAVVDAYDDPNAERDLGVYRAQYHLSACTTANGCFRKVNQSGTTSYPTANAQWAGEISLDLDMVSAVCPTCHILLVEASTTYMTDLGASVDRAVALGARYVSNSYGGAELTSERSADPSYHHPGVVITASTGDSGYGVEYPAASPYVTAVGGTSLTRSGTSRGWSEQVWSGAGSGCSAYEPKPAMQHDTGCPRRSVADVAAVADPNTGVAVYNTYGDGGWAVYGGTSVASPIIAAVYALAGVPRATDMPNTDPYAHPTGLYDVTGGSTGSCGGSYLCTGVTGFDGPTGLGSPSGTGAFGKRQRLAWTAPAIQRSRTKVYFPGRLDG